MLDLPCTAALPGGPDGSPASGSIVNGGRGVTADGPGCHSWGGGERRGGGGGGGALGMYRRLQSRYGRLDHPCTVLHQPPLPEWLFSSAVRLCDGPAWLAARQVYCTAVRQAHLWSCTAACPGAVPATRGEIGHAVRWTPGMPYSAEGPWQGRVGTVCVYAVRCGWTCRWHGGVGRRWSGRTSVV